MKCFLEAIREQKLPTDLLDVLDEAGVRYYEGELRSSGRSAGFGLSSFLSPLAGCLIVEVHDHRSAPQPPALTRPGLALSFQMNHARDVPTASKAEVYRIVLGPNPATLWTEIGLMDRRWQAEKEEEDAVGLTEEEAVEIEAMILVRILQEVLGGEANVRAQARTAPPLCLSPSLQTTRLANTMLRATTLRPPKRKRSCNFAEGDEDEEGGEVARKEREEHERLMKIGDEGVGRGRGHAYAPFHSCDLSRADLAANVASPDWPLSKPTASANPTPIPFPFPSLPLPLPPASSPSVSAVPLSNPAARLPAATPAPLLAPTWSRRNKRDRRRRSCWAARATPTGRQERRSCRRRRKPPRRLLPSRTPRSRSTRSIRRCPTIRWRRRRFSRSESASSGSRSARTRSRGRRTRRSRSRRCSLRMGRRLSLEICRSVGWAGWGLGRRDRVCLGPVVARLWPTLRGQREDSEGDLVQCCWLLPFYSPSTAFSYSLWRAT